MTIFRDKRLDKNVLWFKFLRTKEFSRGKCGSGIQTAFPLFAAKITRLHIFYRGTISSICRPINGVVCANIDTLMPHCIQLWLHFLRKLCAGRDTVQWKLCAGRDTVQHFRLSVHHRHAWRIPWVRISGRSIFLSCCLCDFACLISRHVYLLLC